MKNKGVMRHKLTKLKKIISTETNKLYTKPKKICKKDKSLYTEKGWLCTENCVKLLNYTLKYTIILIIIPTLCTGCWDSMEINNRSVILEFCLDKNNDYKEDKTVPIDTQQRYEMTYSIPDMAKLSGTESLAEDMKTIVTVKAPTIGSGIDDLETKSRNTITFSHVKAFLVGEKLLKDGKLFKEAVDGIARDMLIARNVPLLAVKGPASEAANVDNTQHPIVGLYVMNYFNNKERPIGYFKHQLLGNFIRETQDTGVSTIPIFNIEDKNAINISGGAVIKNYELIDYLTKEEVRGQLFIEGQVKALPIVINYKDRPLTYVIKKETSKVKFEKTPQGLACTVDIQTDGHLTEYVSVKDSDIFNNKSIDEMKALLEKEINRQVQLTVDKSKELDTDFLQIGLALYRNHPEWWKEYEKDWQNGGYTAIPIKVTNHVRIKNTGLLQ